jgi:hypothetical protein
MMNMNLEQFYQLSDDELVGTKGGSGLEETVGIAGVLNAAVQIFNIGYKFASETEI